MRQYYDIVSFYFNITTYYLTMHSSRLYNIDERRIMDTQFKKGVLELIVLKAIVSDDLYGYQLVSRINEVIQVNEGTIYPLLKRLSNDRLLESYLKESTEGPPRKYYHITNLGLERYDALLSEWTDFSDSVNAYLKGVK